MSGTLEQKEQLDSQIFSFPEVACTCVVIDIAYIGSQPFSIVFNGLPRNIFLSGLKVLESKQQLSFFLQTHLLSPFSIYI